jgi:hypothetical protein
MARKYQAITSLSSRLDKTRKQPHIILLLWLMRISNFVFLLHVFSIVCASELSERAVSLQPGAWAELKTRDIRAVLSDAVVGGVGHILSYADHLHWDPITERAYLISSDDPGDGRRFVAYDEATNSWVVLLDPWASAGVAHQYGLTDIDVANRRMYSIVPDGNSGKTYNLTTGVWSDMPAFPSFPYVCCGAAVYFPERGALIYVHGAALRQLDDGGEWSTISSAINTSYHAIAAYSSVRQVVIFGGGSNTAYNFYKVNASKQVTILSSPPVALESPRVEIVPDPVTGNFLVFGRGQYFYIYNPATDAWVDQSSMGVPSEIWAGYGSDLLSTVATPIPKYNIVLFASCDWQWGCAVHIYKHAGGTPGTAAPTTSANLQATSES